MQIVIFSVDSRLFKFFKFLFNYLEGATSGSKSVCIIFYIYTN